MKTVILLRHSKPQKLPSIPNELTPLSDDGLYLAHKLFQNVVFCGADYVCSSPYRRALNTAELLSRSATIDSRLMERQLGDPATLNEKFWEKQYLDHDFKNSGGESLNDTKIRMTAFMNELLSRMREGEKAVVVSHAAAICAYLLNFCTITVADAASKARRICFHGQTVLDGKIKTPGAFLLRFEHGAPVDITYYE